MNHPTDKQLKLWLRSKENFDRDEAVYISEHVETCHLCKERLEKLQKYYEDLKREIDQRPGDREKSIASKVFQRRTKKALPSGSLMQTYEAPLEEYRSSLPVRVKNYLQKHPVGSASISIGTIFIATLLFIIQPWQGGKNGNPTYAEVERNVLQVYDQDGESLWSKVIDGIPNGTTSETKATSTTNRLIGIMDIDGDSRKEVLLTGSNYESELTANKVYCYNSDGSLRWTQSPPEPISFGDLSHTSTMNWEILDFFTLNSTENSARLFVASNSSWFPSVLFELNPSDGEILQSYWHPGWIWVNNVYESANNENDQIILGATNNSYQKAALVVLDPNNINGHAPLKEYYKPNTVSRAAENHYILFKPSRLNELFGNQLYNQISRLRLTDGRGLMVRAVENIGDSSERVTVMYTLNKNFKVLEARGVSKYQRVYSDLYNGGELEEPLTDEYWESLKDSVLYWDERTERFISQSQIEN